MLRHSLALALSVVCGVSSWAAEPPIGNSTPGSELPVLKREYTEQVLPLVRRYCLDCHSTKAKEGELDLEQHADWETLRANAVVWQHVRQMLADGEMPPEDSPQPTAKERQLLQSWTDRFLRAQALSEAGDPGPVVLRRLNNAEYTYTITDLTGVPLDPAREFPVDGAAGEGFTNTGNALSMSPALVQKYLDAGKEIASHAVLLPDGLRFSRYTTRRDWSDEIVQEIRRLYARHTSGNQDVSALDRWAAAAADPKKVTLNDGRVDLGLYFEALSQHRDALIQNPDSAGDIAKRSGLNGKYFLLLAQALTTNEPKGVLLQELQRRWRETAPVDARSVSEWVRGWQDRLWTFNAVGHLGLVQPWQQAINPVANQVTLRLPLSGADDVTVHLISRNAGNADTTNAVIWQRPRLEFPNHPPILLKDVRNIAAHLPVIQAKELPRTDSYLSALLIQRSGKTADPELNPHLLQAWAKLLDLDGDSPLAIRGHFTHRTTKIQGYDAINGWSITGMPSMMTNRSDQPITFLTLTVPARGVVVHPSPTQQAIVTWRSPIAGDISVTGYVADADDKCGNGFAWKLQHATRTGSSNLVAGTVENGGRADLAPANLRIEPGDLLSLIIDPRDKNHACDTTAVQLQIQEQGGQTRTWHLADEVVDRVLESNPLADSCGNAEVWHFHTSSSTKEKPAIPPGSILAAWRKAVVAGESEESITRLAEQVRTTFTAEENSLSEPDRELVQSLKSWTGPLRWTQFALQMPVSDNKVTDYGIDPTIVAPGSGEQNLVLQAPSAAKVFIPKQLGTGEVVAECVLDERSGEASVQVQLVKGAYTDQGLSPEAPILTRDGSRARETLITSYDQFRELFPAAMCHARIVPVDEVVTLILYHREDEHLCRLMLSGEEQARLDQLWRELRYGSQDALRLEVALEQILEFATQDADPRRFDPVRQPIAENAAAYRQWAKETEPVHVRAVLDFTARAYRRPLTAEEQSDLTDLYASLRDQDLTHEEAIRLLLARIFTAPAFLYRLETPAPGPQPSLVSDWEFVTRLSYFLWSSAPDQQLWDAAQANRLQDPDEIWKQTQRMLRDDRVRRLAVEFACQWLGVREFHQVEKNERLYPDFEKLRTDIREESVRFFTDLLQNDRSILNILAAEYTFANGPLAAHYGIPGIAGDQWQRVDTAEKFARGGVLSQAAVLAAQSGASRTSPILRGTWVSEVLLGERLPRPPKDVPVLPDSVSDQLSERELTERHSSDPVCAKCHQRIDPYGFALENFDAIGRFREMDASGHPVRTDTQLMDGEKIDGLRGLQQYLLTKRREDFVRQFCRKLLGYSLGRAVQLSDEPLLEEMQAELKANDYRFSAAVRCIVLSDPFRKIRGRDRTDLATR